MFSRESLELFDMAIGHVVISAPIGSPEFEEARQQHNKARRELDEALKASGPAAGTPEPPPSPRRTRPKR